MQIIIFLIIIIIIIIMTLEFAYGVLSSKKKNARVASSWGKMCCDGKRSF